MAGALLVAACGGSETPEAVGGEDSQVTAPEGEEFDAQLSDEEASALLDELDAEEASGETTVE